MDESVLLSFDLPLVSVVVVCFKDIQITRQCLTHIFRQTYPSVEVIVVDNASPENIHEMVSREFPRARVICLERNSGFAGGHNVGIRAAQGKYIAIINNDALAGPDWLAAMVKIAEQNSDIGSVASIITDGNQPDRLDSCGVGIGLDGMSRQAMRRQQVPLLLAPKEILMPSGCACLFRKEALEAVGLFDESFFAYCEDTDLGLRLRWAGYTCVVAPGAEVRHYYSITAGKFSQAKIFWVERNHYWVGLKNFPMALLLLLPFATVWRYIIELYAVLTRTGDLHEFIEDASFFKTVLTILKAHLAALSGAFSMIRKRLLFSPKRKLSPTQMISLIWSQRLSIAEIVLGGENAR